VDLISNKAIIWDDESKGMHYSEGPVPEDMLEIVDEYRTRLIEGCAEEEDELMEKYFVDHNSITVEEMRRIIRQATLEMKINPVVCGSAFKIKVFKTCSMQLLAICLILMMFLLFQV
jgi:elongation factor G